MGVEVGATGQPNSTGTRTITGLPFQPVAVLFFCTFQNLTPHRFTLGCATADDEQWCVYIATGTQDASDAYTARSHQTRTDRCMQMGTDGVTWTAEFVSMNSDGFTINFPNRGGSGTGSIFYVALGGNHISAARAGTFDAGASTGTVAVTDPGFQPTALITAHTGDATFDLGSQFHLQLGVGCADSALNQYSFFTRGPRGVTGQSQHIHRTDEIACVYDGTNTFRMALDSMDASGFTVNVTDAWTGDITHGYLALEADGAVAGNGVQPDATGLQTFPTPGLIPGGVFFLHSGVDAPSTTGATNVILRPGVSVMDGTDEGAASGIFRVATSFGVFTSDGYTIGSAFRLMGSGTGVGGSDNNVRSQAKWSAFGDDGSFTIEWTTADAIADRAFGWIALPGELIAPWVPQQYRRVLV